MTHFIIHNHLPKRKGNTKDAESKFNEGDPVSVKEAYRRPNQKGGKIVELSSPSGHIYTVRFSDGSEAYIHESDLSKR